MQERKSIEEVLDTPQKKLAFYQNLILLAAADGVLDSKESRFLVDIGNRMGLTAEEAMPIADNLNVLSFIIPEDGLQKTLELQTLVQLMVQDGHIHDREYALCLEYTYRIGYSKVVLDDMISQFSGGQSAAQ
jgi:DnaJ-domain-containing protein 1